MFPPHSILVSRSGKMYLGDHAFPYTPGKSGFIAPEDKREGDYATPTGNYPLRSIYYRPDRITLPSYTLPTHRITEAMGWCDDPTDSRYNQPVTLPCPASHELLWREDGAYDLVIVIGYNDAPAIPDKGSAIFIHCLHDDGRPTAGCIALPREHMLTLLPILTPETTIELGA